MVEGGDEDGECLEVVHADVELVLEHAGALVAHAGEGLPALLDGLGVLVVEDPAGSERPAEDPEQQQPAPPALPHGAGAQVVGVHVAPQRLGR